MALDEIRKTKIDKIMALKKARINPYPAETSRTHDIAGTIGQFDKLSESKAEVTLAGRILARREHGGSMFCDINDGTGKIQFYLKEDVIGKDEFNKFRELIDIGDFIEAKGTLFKTKKEEKTLEVSRYKLLSKALLPLPEKWHGLQDVEERFRKRYLDIMFNSEVKEKFILRGKIIKAVRNFMDGNDFLEVTTPTLQPLYGGASARPFKTHMHDLDVDLYLRIAPELYLKRLLVAGFPAVYEFTTNFRNEGTDREHNPEFSAMEYYIAYKDHEWSMDYTEKMLSHVLKEVFDKTSIDYEGKEIDFRAPYARVKFKDLLKEHAGIDYAGASEADMRAKAKELGIVIEKIVDKAGLADEIFKKAIRSKLIMPTFVTEYPADLLPLAKRLDSDPSYVGAFQFFAGGFELIKAFTELNDPLDQRERFENQESRRAKGDEEAQRMDEDYIEALEYGMPPATGWGLGIDRLVMLLTGAHSVREVILFPLMRPK